MTRHVQCLSSHLYNDKVNIYKKNMFLENHISIFEWGSCDTEDWNNGYWKFSFSITGINYILK